MNINRLKLNINIQLLFKVVLINLFSLLYSCNAESQDLKNEILGNWVIEDTMSLEDSSGISISKMSFNKDYMEITISDGINKKFKYKLEGDTIIVSMIERPVELDGERMLIKSINKDYMKIECLIDGRIVKTCAFKKVKE